MKNQLNYIIYNFDRKEWNCKKYHGVDFYKPDWIQECAAVFAKEHPGYELVEIHAMQTKHKMPEYGDVYDKEPIPSKDGLNIAGRCIWRKKGEKKTFAGSWVFLDAWGAGLASLCAILCASFCAFCVRNGSFHSCTRGAVLGFAQADNSYNPVEPPVAKAMGGRPKGGAGDLAPAIKELEFDTFEIGKTKLKTVPHSLCLMEKINEIIRAINKE